MEQRLTRRSLAGSFFLIFALTQYVTTTLWTIRTPFYNSPTAHLITPLCLAAVAVALFAGKRPLAIFACLIMAFWEMRLLFSFGIFGNGSRLMRVVTICEMLAAAAWWLLFMACGARGKSLRFAIFSAVLLALGRWLLVENRCADAYALMAVLFYALGALLMGWEYDSRPQANAVQAAIRRTDIDPAVQERLDKLRVFVDNGLMTEEEYAQRREKLLKK
ncbi:MAG: SHOCT domain-containing protein [Oscillospiraceae bacterium]|nr:SHOCT domain-containing protein [Oscillospiraceae bacterium]